MSENDKKCEHCAICRNLTKIVALLALGLALCGILGVLSLKNYIARKEFATKEYVREYIDSVNEYNDEQGEKESSKVDCNAARDEEQAARCIWLNNSYGFSEEE